MAPPRPSLLLTWVAFGWRLEGMGGVLVCETPPHKSLTPQGFVACVAFVAFYLGSLFFLFLVGYSSVSPLRLGGVHSALMMVPSSNGMGIIGCRLSASNFLRVPKVKNKRHKRHTCLKALQDKAFAGGVSLAQTPHTHPKRHPNATHAFR